MSDPGLSRKRPADESDSDEETTPTKNKFVPNTLIFGPWCFKGNLPNAYFRRPLNSPVAEIEIIESESDQSDAEIEIIESESDQSDAEIEILECESEQPDDDIQIIESESDQADDDIQIIESESDQADDKNEILESQSASDQVDDESSEYLDESSAKVEMEHQDSALKANEPYSLETTDWVQILGSENTEPLPEKDKNMEYLRARKSKIAKQMSWTEFVPTVVAFWALHPLDRRYQKARAKREYEKEQRFKANYCSLVTLLTLVRGTRMPGQCLYLKTEFNLKPLVMDVMLDFIKYYIQSLLFNFKSNGISCESIVSCYYNNVGYVTMPNCDYATTNYQANEYSTWTEAQKEIASKVIKNIIEVVEEIRFLVVKYRISINELHDHAHAEIMDCTYNLEQVLYQKEHPSLSKQVDEALKQCAKNQYRHVRYVGSYPRLKINIDGLHTQLKVVDESSAAEASEFALQRSLNQLSAEYETSLVEAQHETPPSVRRRLPYQKLNKKFLNKRKELLANYVKEPHMLPVVLDFWALHPFYRKCPVEEYVLAEEERKLQIHRYLRHILLVAPEPAPREDQYPIPNKEMLEGMFKYTKRNFFNRKLVMKLINEHIRHVLGEMIESWSARYEEIICCYELAWDVRLPRQFSHVTYDRPILPLQRFSPYTTDEIEKAGNGLTKIGVFLRKCFDHYDIDVAEFHEMVDQLPRDYQFELDEAFELIKLSKKREHFLLRAFKQVNLLANSICFNEISLKNYGLKLKNSKFIDLMA
ncbi:hypothetical protein GCK72_022816 [Caenorhabditis remanei]|uniref:Uncharacterized protein n=1 Tax=Caenorhabditis remanei TaxID=31234 RepID=A0A6A5FUZ1_CAERE|nr:hypothetical protein GCK72_022816 [Caenorhabditis remanei]KAF1746363.1 hypothetical protein GCK72_022816 [Caenorhabditis remanei]